LRKRFREGRTPYWKYYDTTSGEWVGGIDVFIDRSLAVTQYLPISEEEALVIILTKQWNEMKLRP